MTSFTSSYGKKMLRASISGQTLAKVPRIDSLSSDHYWCESGLDQDGFCKMFINQYIGFGVFATKTFYKGDFLLEYVGERISLEEAVEREKKRKNNRCYMYYFRYREKTCCIDATDTNNRLCRYVNDSAVKSAKCNSKMKLKVFNSNYPRLCLYATKTIPKGQEIRYDYGDADKNLEWRNLETVLFIKTKLQANLGISIFKKIPQELKKKYHLSIFHTRKYFITKISYFYLQHDNWAWLFKA